MSAVRFHTFSYSVLPYYSKKNQGILGLFEIYGELFRKFFKPCAYFVLFVPDRRPLGLVKRFSGKLTARSAVLQRQREGGRRQSAPAAQVPLRGIGHVGHGEMNLGNIHALRELDANRI